MKKIRSLVLCALSIALCPFVLTAQQLPDSHFEDWSKVYNGDAQLANWNGSNVTQVGLKFTFMYQKPGRTGSCLYVTDRTIGAIGITATGLIRKMGRADSKTIPIIALTANAFDEDVERSLQAGLNAHLTKPVEPDVLFNTLRRLVKE